MDILSYPYLHLWVSSVIIGVVVVVPWLFELVKRRFDLFNLKNVFLLYIFLQFTLWPLMMYLGEVDVLWGHRVTFLSDYYDSFVKGQYCVLIGVLFFYHGYYTFTTKKSRSQLSLSGVSKQEYSVNWDENRVYFVFLASIVVAAISLLLLVNSSGGMAYFIQNIDLLRNTELAGWGVYLYPIMASQIGVSVFTAYSFIKKSNQWLAILGVIFLLMCAFVIGMRAFMITPLLVTLFLYHMTKKRIRLDIKLVLALVIFIGFNIWYASFRSAGFDAQEYSAGLTVKEKMLNFFGRFHGGDSMSRILEETEKNDFQYGVVTIQGLMVAPIPRTIWPDKPLSPGVIGNLTFWPEFFSKDDTGAFVLTLNGELYWIMGLPAICGGMYLFGMSFRRQVQKIQKPCAEHLLVYSCWLIFAAFVNETLSLHLFTLLFKLAVLCCVFIFVRKTRTSRMSTTSSLHSVEIVV